MNAPRRPLLSSMLLVLLVACSDPARDTLAPHLVQLDDGRHTIIVNPNANGNGIAATIQEGIDRVAPGGTVQITAGTYAEALVIPKGLTLQGIGDGSAPVIVAPSGAAQAVNVTTTEPVVIRGLSVQGSPFGIRASNLAANLTVERTSIRDNSTAGITATWSTTPGGPTARLVVRHSLVEGNAVRPSSGISTQGDVNAVIEHNVVRGTTNRCINVAFGSAVQVGVSTTVDILANDLDRCGIASGVNVTTANLQTGVRVANVVGNTIRNSDAEPIRNGVYFEGFAGRVEHNSIIGVVQPTANPAAEAIAGCCVVAPAGIFVGSLRGAAASTPVVRLNDIEGNAFAGLRIGPNQPVSLDARCNYWGSASGPSGVGSGTGDAVLVETGGARPVLGPFATAPVAGSAESCGVEFSLWSTPVNLGPTINSTVGEFGGALSPDGLALYFNSNRPGSAGTDLWFARRACRECPWGPAQNLGATLNGPTAEGGADFSTDGRLLFFNSDRPGGFGLRDIYVSRRDDPADDLGWGPPVNLGPYVNTPADEQSASYFRGEPTGSVTLYFHRGLGGPIPDNTTDIYAVEFSPAGEPLAAAVAVAELNDPSLQDASPAVRDDGREIIFASSRAGGAGGAPGTALDLWFSTRPSIRDPWSSPEYLGAPLNTTGTEGDATLSRDGLVLLFFSGRTGGIGMNDIWMSTRTRIGRDE